MSDASRYCPECETRTNELLCPHDGTQTVSESAFEGDDADALLGRVFAGRYQIEAVIGVGGMGKVYQATQLSMGRQMALKMLHPDLAKTREYVRRFYREAKAASGLDSPHVVRIFDFGLDEDTKRSFMAMELLKGTDLRGHLDAHGPMPVKRACDILAQAGRALIEAHAVGLVHRDLKPDNIHLQRMSDGADFVKVMDFGIAKFLKGAEEGNTDLTGTGMTLGTAAYMAPEQVRGEPVDFRADLYAMGGILHELLTGETPFNADTRMSLMLMHMTRPAPELPDHDIEGSPIPPALRHLHAALLAKHRYERPGTSALMVDVLKAVARGEDVDAAALLEALHVQGSDGQHTQPVDTDLVIGLSDTKAAPTPLAQRAIAEPLAMATAAGATWAAAEPAKPSNRVLWIALAAVVLLGWGGVAVWFATSSSAEEPGQAVAGAGSSHAQGAPSGKHKSLGADAEERAKASKKREEHVAAADADPPSSPATALLGAAVPSKAQPAGARPVEVEVEVAPPAPEAVPAPAPRTLVIRSKPAAHVIDGDEDLGETPVTLTVPAGAPDRELKLTRTGYQDGSVTVTADTIEDVEITLDRRRTSPPRVKASPRPAASPNEDKSGKW